MPFAVIIPAKTLETALTQQYVSETSLVVIGRTTATNTTTGDIALTVYLPEQASGVASNKIINARLIGPGETYRCMELSGHVIQPGGSVDTETSAPGITFRMSGQEAT